MYENNNMNNTFSDNYEMTVSGVENVTRKGKGRKAAMTAGGIAAIIACSSITAYAASDTVKNQVKLRLSSPEKYYAWITEKNAETIGETVGKYYRSLLEKREKGQNINFEISFEPTQDTKELLNEEIFGNASDMPEEIKKVVNDTDKYTLSSDYKIKKSAISSNSEIIMDDKSVLHFDLSADFKDMDYFLRIPELKEQWLGVKMGDGLSLYGVGAILESYKAIFKDPSSFISPDELENEVNRYAGVWANFVDEVKLDKKYSVDICDINVNYTVATVNLTDKDLDKLGLQYLEEMKKDIVIKDIIVNKINLFDDETEYIEALDDSISEFKVDLEENDYDNEVVVSIDAYIDASGNIRGFGFRNDDDESLRIVIGRDGSAVRGEVVFAENNEPIFKASLKADESDKNYTGDLTLIFSDYYNYNLSEGHNDNTYQETISVNFSNVEIKDEEKGYFNGDFSIFIPDNDPIDILCSSDGKSQNVKYDLNIGNTCYGGLSIRYSVENSADVNLPNKSDAFMLDFNNVYDADIDDYITSNDIRDFIKNTLENIGFDKEVAEIAGDAAKEGYDKRADERASWEDYEWDSENFDFDLEIDDEDEKEFRSTAGSEKKEDIIGSADSQSGIVIGGSNDIGLDFEFDPSQFKYEDFKDQMTEEEFNQWMDLMEQFTKKAS